MSKNAPKLYEVNENFIYTTILLAPATDCERLVGGKRHVVTVQGAQRKRTQAKKKIRMKVPCGKLWPGPEEKDNHCNISDTDELPLTEKCKKSQTRRRKNVS